uniref:Anaphase-promoting complex subunit 5 n=1 Tax=Eptatretus burgeri TaxID=7764 RepID=A0A8C4QRY7_EPTBU
MATGVDAMGSLPSDIDVPIEAPSPADVATLLLFDDLLGKNVKLEPNEVHELLLLFLRLLQGPDVKFLDLCNHVESFSHELAHHLYTRMKAFMGDGVQELSDFIARLDVEPSSPTFAMGINSILVMFVRRTVLAYNKLSFSQTQQFHILLQKYFHAKSQPEEQSHTCRRLNMSPTNNDKDLIRCSFNRVPADREETPWITSNDFQEDGQQHNVPNSKPMTLPDKPWRTPTMPLSKRQAEIFLYEQASLLLWNEEAAEIPVVMQAHVSDILESNPDFTRARYLTYLNSMRVRDVFSATHALRHYFDRRPPLIAEDAGGEALDDSSSLRYAALSQAALHCQLGHLEETQLALQEAIQKAQEAADHVCLQHCLSWLAQLEQLKGLRGQALLQHSVRKASSQKPTTSLSLQALLRHLASTGYSPSTVFEAVTMLNTLHAKLLLSDLYALATVQRAALWRMYGKSRLAMQQCQLLLFFPPRDEGFGESSVELGTESVCVALCHLAEMHAAQGRCMAAMEILEYCRQRFPPHSQYAKLWMRSRLKILMTKALAEDKPHEAEPLVTRMCALDTAEGMYRKGLVLKALGQSQEAAAIFHQNIAACERAQPGFGPEIHIKSQLALAELQVQAGSSCQAIPLFMAGLSRARAGHFQNLALRALVGLAHAQLLLGLPEECGRLLAAIADPILAHGSAWQCGRLLLLIAQGQLAAHTQDRTQALQQALSNLNQAQRWLLAANCGPATRDTAYLQARICHQLGLFSQRNKHALVFKQLQTEFPTHSTPPLTMH